MIFAHTLDRVLGGEKWQTRRVIKADEQLTRTDGKVRVEVPGKRVVYEVGKSYAVQPGRGKHAVARIVLTGIRRESVAAISNFDAAAEGYRSREAFLKTWHAIHGDRANLQDEVWVLEFRLDNTEDLITAHGNQHAANKRTHHGHDLSPSVTGLSGTGLHGRDH